MEQTIPQIHLLLKDELIYEVSIRYENPATTVVELRKQLKTLFKECPSSDILQTDLNPDQELTAISQKLQDLEELLQKYEQTHDRHAHCRSRALASHLYYRLTRIHSSDKTLMVRKGELDSKLDLLLSKILPDSDSTQEEVSVHSLSPMVECTGDKNIAKWKITYNGLGDPYSFVERVEEYKNSYGISDSKLFASAFHLFSGQALLWYRGVKSLVSSWSQLKKILLEEFTPIDYDYRLLGDLRSRTQGKDEPISIYFSIMLCMFARLKSPLPEEQKIEILLHNIRPFYSDQLALIKFDSVASLKDHCRKIEAAKQRSSLFSEPTSSFLTNQNSEFAYKPKAKHINEISHPRPTTSQEIKNKFGSLQKPDQTTRQTCYKCGKGHHDFKKCNITPNKLRCFGCGAEGYTISTCGNCANKKVSRQKSTARHQPSGSNSKN